MGDVTKINGFRAPYRSSTFRDVALAHIDRNGLLDIGSGLSEAAGTLTVPPLVFIQEGIIIQKSVSTPVVINPATPEPLFLYVNSPSDNDQDDLVWAVAKAPDEIAAGMAIIAEKSNGEWRPMFDISTRGIVSSLFQDNIDKGVRRPINGLTTSLNGGNYETIAGEIIDSRGERKQVPALVTIPKVAGDPDFSRVDRMVYRRELDNTNRVGRVALAIGGTYNDAGQTNNETDFVSGPAVHSAVKNLVLSDNRLAVLYAEGYGGTYDIKFALYSSDRTTEVVAPTTVASSVTSDQFDAVMDSSDILHLAIAKTNDLCIQRVNGTSGALIGGQIVVSDQTKPVDRPKIVIDYRDRITVVYEQLEGPSNTQIYYTVRTSTTALIRAVDRIVSNANNVRYPHVYINEDLKPNFVYADLTDGKVYHTTYNDEGDEVDAPVEVSGGKTTPVYPKVIITENKETFVFFLHDVGSDWKMGIYNGGSVTVPELESAGESFVAYDVHVDGIFNGIHFTLAQDTTVDYAKILNGIVQIQENLSSAGAVSVAIVFDRFGSLVHTWSDDRAGTYTPYGAPVTVNHIGPVSVVGALNTIVLAADECIIPIASVPNIDDKATIAGSGAGNDGDYIVELVTTVSLDAPNDKAVVKMTSNFNGVESPAGGVTLAKSSPDGGVATFIKSISELNTHAFTRDELSSDAMLARIIQPGDVILNYTLGSEPLVNTDHLGIFGSVVIDWGKTTGGEITLVGTTEIVDFYYSNIYSIPGANLAMSNDEALYIVLDPSDLAPTFQVKPIEQLPFDQPIQVFGFVKSGTFYPKLLMIADVGALDDGEATAYGEDLELDHRTRLGLTSETSVEPYTSTTRINAGDSYPTAISKLDAAASGGATAANQDRGMKIVRGGTWYWDEANDNLEISVDAFVQIPGLPEARNKIALSGSPFTIDADGKCLYATVNRVAGAAAEVVLAVADIGSVPVTDNILIIARRVGDSMLVGNGTFLLQPGERLELDGANAELGRYLRRIKMVQHPTNPLRIKVTGASSDMLDGSKIGQTLSGLLLDFDGANIDPVNGIIYKADDSTPLGISFTPPTVAADKYRWLSFALVPGAVNANNTIAAQGVVLIGDADGATADAATRAAMGGVIEVGEFYLKRNVGGTAFEDITNDNIVNLSIGSAGGDVGGLKVDYLDPISTVLPTGATVTIDGQAGVNGDLVLFSNLIAGNNKVYELSGVGSAIAWAAKTFFKGSEDPLDAEAVRIRKGDGFHEQLAVYDDGASAWTVNDVVRFFNGADYWEMTSPKSLTLSNDTSGNIFTVNALGSENFVMFLSAVRGLKKRTGVFPITQNGTDASLGGLEAYLDEMGVVLDPVINGSDFELNFTINDQASDATIRYHLMRWSDSPGGPGGVPSYAGSGGSPIPAAGNIGEIQRKGSDGNLAASPELNFDDSTKEVGLNGLFYGTLKGPLVINDNQAAPAVLFSYPKSTKKAILEYGIDRGTIVCTGRLLIVTNGTLSDEAGDCVDIGGVTGVTIDSAVNGSNVDVRYTSTSTGQAGTLTYSLRRW